MYLTFFEMARQKVVRKRLSISILKDQDLSESSE